MAEMVQHGGALFEGGFAHGALQFLTFRHFDGQRWVEFVGGGHLGAHLLFLMVVQAGNGGENFVALRAFGNFGFFCKSKRRFFFKMND